MPGRKDANLPMKNLNIVNKEASNAYQEDYMKFHLMERPDFFEFYLKGGVDLDEYLPKLLGSVKGLKLLDTCCACDAKQAFSWHNLGAKVTACDISDKAIAIASQNAANMNFDISFVVADMQSLEPIADNSHDIVFATYPVWVQDINEACKAWSRVLKDGGKLLWHMSHPVTDCLSANKDSLNVVTNYNAPHTEMYSRFDGTPMANRQAGGWSVELPVAEHFWRISDILNAVAGAGFKIAQTHEAYDVRNSHKFTHRDAKSGQEQMCNLPGEFTVLAVK